MILLTVGTYPLQFNRFIKEIDKLVQEQIIKDEVYGQIGYCTYEPKHFPFDRMIDKEKFESLISRANAIIGHAGMGTITLALDNNKPLLVLPRMKKYGEMVNDHQVDSAKIFSELGHVLSAISEDELAGKFTELKSFIPKKRICQPEEISKLISSYLISCNKT